jgi:hypothetical protein
MPSFGEEVKNNTFLPLQEELGCIQNCIRRYRRGKALQDVVSCFSNTQLARNSSIRKKGGKENV